MGLTLHYQFAAAARKADEVRAMVEALRAYAKSLPFERVSEMIELKGEECIFAGEVEDPHAWLKIQATRYVLETEGDTTYAKEEIPPIHLIAFTVRPGQGSEAVNFGLCRYAEETSDWSWSSGCKTQYASNPSMGDVANFLKCHLGLIEVLDKAKEMGILERVMDEGKYWEERDVEALTKEVGMWNQMIAGFYGSLRDSMEASGGDARSIEAEIARFGNFERLEAEGRKEGAR